MSKPSINDFRKNYPNDKTNRNLIRLWRWLVVGRIGFYISWIAARMNISANSITILSFILGLIGISLLIKGKFILGIIGINLWYLFDCSDGNLSRYYKIKSNLGKFLDEAFGEIITVFMWFSIGLGLYLKPDLTIDLNNLIRNDLFLISGAFISISIALRNCISNRFSNSYFDSLNVNHDNSREETHDKSRSLGRYLWDILSSFGGIQAPLLIVFSFLDYLGILLIFYTFLYGFHFIFSLMNYILKLKKLEYK